MSKDPSIICTCESIRERKPQVDSVHRYRTHSFRKSYIESLRDVGLWTIFIHYIYMYAHVGTCIRTCIFRGHSLTRFHARYALALEWLFRHFDPLPWSTLVVWIYNLTFPGANIYFCYCSCVCDSSKTYTLM